MTFEEYVKQLQAEGFNRHAKYMVGEEVKAVDMYHSSEGLIITVKNETYVTAQACITVPGFMQPIVTGYFGSPWDNSAFFVQSQRLLTIKRLVGDFLLL